MSTQAQRRSPRAAVDGVFLLNKPPGMTSNQALQRVKRLFNAKKAGHTGSLDPAATGMLPLCFGEATKICAYLLEADKTYRVTARLGEATDTGDADGEITATAEVPGISTEDWREIMKGFLGEIQQVPPMYSALKKDGKRLYELARQGQVVDRDPRTVQIHEIELTEFAGKRLSFRVRCSKGTYVRTLVEDLAKAAGTLAHTASLHREGVGSFPSSDMLDMPTVERLATVGMDALLERLLPVDSALTAWPQVELSPLEAQRFRDGQKIQLEAARQPGNGLVRAYAEGGRFAGIGEADASGGLAPRRIFS